MSIRGFWPRDCRSLNPPVGCFVYRPAAQASKTVSLAREMKSRRNPYTTHSRWYNPPKNLQIRRLKFDSFLTSSSLSLSPRLLGEIENVTDFFPLFWCVVLWSPGGCIILKNMAIDIAPYILFYSFPTSSPLPGDRIGNGNDEKHLLPLIIIIKKKRVLNHFFFTSRIMYT